MSSFKSMTCKFCGDEFTKEGLKTHKRRNKFGQCQVKKELKLKKTEAEKRLSEMDPGEILKNLQIAEESKSMREMLMNTQLTLIKQEKVNKQMKRRTEEHVRMLKKFVPNGYKPTIPGTLRLNVAGGQSWKCAICESDLKALILI